MNEREILLKKMQAEDFAVYEIVLYLDAYPCNEKALDAYNKHRDTLRELKNEYTRRYGPLTIYENTDPPRWRWIDGPWPWEREAN